jgi:hypothetical protein
MQKVECVPFYQVLCLAYVSDFVRDWMTQEIDKRRAVFTELVPYREVVAACDNGPHSDLCCCFASKNAVQFVAKSRLSAISLSLFLSR